MRFVAKDANPPISTSCVQGLQVDLHESYVPSFFQLSSDPGKWDKSGGIL